jgi:hypothetical protein
MISESQAGIGVDSVANFIPFEPQADSPGNRLCGAASLCMVYRSLGIECAQQEIWEKVARPERGGRRARTYLLAADALERGLAALVVQARQPWAILERCVARGVRLILNQRIQLDSPAGHYTVLVSINETEAILHDPATGPNQTVSREDLLKLWEANWGRCEIVGEVLVAVAQKPAECVACAECGTMPPPHVECPRCRKQVVLEPSAALGCVVLNCPQRLWKYLYCPSCDGRISVVATPLAPENNDKKLSSE